MYNLQEAYLGVYYDLDEANRMERELEAQGKLPTSEKIRRRNVGWKSSKSRQNYNIDGYQKSKKDPNVKIGDREEMTYPYRSNYHKLPQKYDILPHGSSDNYISSGTNRYVNPNERLKDHVRSELARRRKKQQAEQLDLYDLIFDYLLDEGYADTEEAATVIMANMSEEWVNSIADAYVPYEGKPQENLRAKQDKLYRNWDKPGSEQRFHKLGKVDTTMTNPTTKGSREEMNRIRDLELKRR